MFESESIFENQNRIFTISIFHYVVVSIIHIVQSMVVSLPSSHGSLEAMFLLQHILKLLI